jgi:hypothetical protein
VQSTGREFHGREPRSCGPDCRPRSLSGFGKHLAPPTVAYFLAEQDKEVGHVYERFDFAQGVDYGTRLARRRIMHATPEGARAATAV